MNERYTDTTNHTTLVTDLLLPSGRLLQCLWYTIKCSCDNWQQIFEKINVKNNCLTNEIQVPADTSRKVYLTLTLMRSTGITMSYHPLELVQQAFLGCVYLLQHLYHPSLEIWTSMYLHVIKETILCYQFHYCLQSSQHNELHPSWWQNAPR